MRSRAIAALIIAACLPLAAACSSDNKTEPKPKTSSTTQLEPRAEAAAELDAEAVAEELQKVIPTLKATVVYTEQTDPNKRMGRPHQYTSKVAFTDSRVNKAAAKKDDRGRPDAIAYGGTVEVFETAADAKAWADGIDKLSGSVGAFITPDYLYRQGRYVIRASNHLAPGHAAEYEKALADIG